VDARLPHLFFEPRMVRFLNWYLDVAWLWCKRTVLHSPRWLLRIPLCKPGPGTSVIYIPLHAEEQSAKFQLTSPITLEGFHQGSRQAYHHRIPMSLRWKLQGLWGLISQPNLGTSAALAFLQWHLPPDQPCLTNFNDLQCYWQVPLLFDMICIALILLVFLFHTHEGFP
jgi:hypothetical protein